jgi:hypothetical protein
VASAGPGTATLEAPATQGAFHANRRRRPDAPAAGRLCRRPARTPTSRWWPRPAKRWAASACTAFMEAAGPLGQRQPAVLQTIPADAELTSYRQVGPVLDWDGYTALGRRSAGRQSRAGAAPSPRPARPRRQGVRRRAGRRDRRPRRREQAADLLLLRRQGRAMGRAGRALVVLRGHLRQRQPAPCRAVHAVRRHHRRGARHGAAAGLGGPRQPGRDPWRPRTRRPDAAGGRRPPPPPRPSCRRSSPASTRPTPPQRSSPRPSPSSWAASSTISDRRQDRRTLHSSPGRVRESTRSSDENGTDTMAGACERLALRRRPRWTRVRSGARKAPEVEALVDLGLLQAPDGVAFPGRSGPGVPRHRLPGWRTCR